jgi:hypothetical protein
MPISRPKIFRVAAFQGGRVRQDQKPVRQAVKPAVEQLRGIACLTNQRRFLLPALRAWSSHNVPSVNSIRGMEMARTSKSRNVPTRIPRDITNNESYCATFRILWQRGSPCSCPTYG